MADLDRAEDSLEETKEAIRQKLKVEDGVQVQLAQLRGGMTIDLEDGSCFGSLFECGRLN